MLLPIRSGKLMAMLSSVRPPLEFVLTKLPLELLAAMTGVMLPVLTSGHVGAGSAGPIEVDGRARRDRARSRPGRASPKSTVGGAGVGVIGLEDQVAGAPLDQVPVHARGVAELAEDGQSFRPGAVDAQSC